MNASVAQTSASSSTPFQEPVAGNYFVAAYPPFSAWSRDQVPALHDALVTPPSSAPLGLYVHVPFCQKKCEYCYYLSYIAQPAEVVNRYIDAVIGEAELYARQPGIQNRPLSFAYFGGGTPSTLSSAQLERLANGLQTSLAWDKIKEVTFECAPRSVRPEFLASLKALGVTRISMGVQSFDNELLKLNGRVHLAEDVVRAYNQIRDAEFASVNLDLMCGLIGETERKWRDTVRQVIDLAPDSVTIYQTEIPLNTVLYRELEEGKLSSPPISWHEKRTRLDEGFRRLERVGYRLTSAYNAVKDPGKHPFLYQDYLWKGADMLGLGVASFGYYGGIHVQNATSLEQYEAVVKQGEIPAQRAFNLSKRDQLVREFILQLKLGEVHVTPFLEKFDASPIEEFSETLSAMVEKGYLTVSDKVVRLKRPGLLCIDRLLQNFYDSRFRDTRYT